MERTRRGKLLDEAVEWCRERGVEFWNVNKDYPEESLENNNHFSRKLKADYSIDDLRYRRFARLGGDSYQIITKLYQKLSQSTETEVRRTAGSSQKRNIGGSADKMLLQKIFL